MSAWGWIGLGVAATALLYAAFVLALVVAGRGEAARAAARFVPDCVVLLRRIVADERTPRRRKLLLVALLGYLLTPIDLVPDVIPVAGQLDDAIVVALALRCVLRAGGPAMLRRHWPGPPASLRAILRVAYGRAA